MAPNALMFTFSAELLIASVIVFRVVYFRGASQFAFHGEFIMPAQLRLQKWSVLNRIREFMTPLRYIKS